MSITLTEGETRRLDITLVPIPPALATLLGIVTDADTGYGIASVLVEVLGTGLSVYTDARGGYQITEIEPGTYTIRFSHPDYETLEI